MRKPQNPALQMGMLGFAIVQGSHRLMDHWAQLSIVVLLPTKVENTFSYRDLLRIWRTDNLGQSRVGLSTVPFNSCPGMT